MIKKNDTIHYRLYEHPVRRSLEGNYYCRAMNAVTNADYTLCRDCPLFAGMYNDEKGKCHPECRYYSFEELYRSDMEPYDHKQRIDGLIASGLISEFPDYLPVGEESERYGVIEAAIRFAAQAHRGDTRKGSGLPYIIHPVEVMMLTARMTDDAEVIAAAALHDVVEDTPYTIGDIEKNFGKRIASIVHAESEDKREGQPKADTWKIRKQENLEREANAPREAKIVMLADKISNMRATLRDYREKGDEIWLRFNMRDPKEQEWYYRSVANVLLELSDLPQYQEYIDIVNEVFAKKRM